MCSNFLTMSLKLLLCPNISVALPPTLIFLLFPDELANRMTIGNHYRIIGIPACVQNGLQATACIEVNSVQLYKPNGKKVPLKIGLKRKLENLLEKKNLENWYRFLLSRGPDYKTIQGLSSYSLKCVLAVIWEYLLLPTFYALGNSLIIYCSSSTSLSIFSYTLESTLKSYKMHLIFQFVFPFLFHQF